MSAVVLAVDLGGTKVLTQLANLQGDIIFERRFDSALYADFAALLTDFFQQEAVSGYQVVAACFAVAGPVVGHIADLTNLPWVIDSNALLSQFPLGRLRLCNDFVAVAYGIDAVHQNDLLCLQSGQLDADAPRAVIGAGTGLGQAIILPLESGLQVIAMEGGNVDFAPCDEQQIALLQYLMPQMSHVSYERLLSGPGIGLLYQFILAEAGIKLPEEMSLTCKEGTAAGLISQRAKENDPYARQALQLFMRIYGAQAGNLALNTIARGGVFIAGGIAAKNQDALLEGDFMQAFLDKGKMSHLMPLMPITLITDEKVGLSGARYLALQEAV